MTKPKPMPILARVAFVRETLKRIRPGLSSANRRKVTGWLRQLDLSRQCASRSLSDCSRRRVCSSCFLAFLAVDGCAFFRRRLGGFGSRVG